MTTQQKIDALVNEALSLEATEGASSKTAKLLREAVRLQDEMEMSEGVHWTQQMEYDCEVLVEVTTVQTGW